jgi:hypothetical protein
MMNRIRRISPILFLVVLMSSCGGGGGGDGDGVNDDDQNPSPPSNQNVNGGLTGRLFTSERTEGWAIDLATGKATQLPAKGWWYLADYTGYSTHLKGYANDSGTVFLLQGTDCFDELNGKLGEYDCFGVLDEMGTLIGERGVLPKGVREARLSKNEQYIAITYADDRYQAPLSHLVIYDRTYNLISESTMKDGIGEDNLYGEHGIDWSVNGNLVYAYKKSLYITSVYSAEGSPIYTASGSSSSEYPFPAAPKVSPDGSKIAFRLVSESNYQISEATIWVMNSDGSDLHQLAHDSGSYQVFNNLTWSPDGLYILVTEGGMGGDPITGGASDHIYAIPSNSRDVELGCDDTSGIICVRTYFKNPEDLTYDYDSYTSVFQWIK